MEFLILLSVLIGYAIFFVLLIGILCLLLFPLCCLPNYLLDIFWPNRSSVIIKSSDILLRYEVPFFAFPFSSLIILFVSVVFFSGNIFVFCVLTLGYCILYFLGMYRKLINKKERMKQVWENNRSYLKLSFAAVGFVITVVSFLHGFSLLGKPDLKTFFINLVNVRNSILSFFMTDLSIVCNRFLDIFEIIIILIPLAYISSLPLQIFSYLLIKMGEYFWKNKESYKKYFQFYLIILNYVKKFMSFCFR